MSCRNVTKINGYQSETEVSVANVCLHGTELIISSLYIAQASLQKRRNYFAYTLFQNGSCLRRSGSSSTRARHRGPRFNVYMFTCGSIVRNMPQNCCVPGCKKKVYEEDGVKISFHKFPEDRELFRKWIVAIRRDVGKEFRVTDHTRV